MPVENCASDTPFGRSIHTTLFGIVTAEAVRLTRWPFVPAKVIAAFWPGVETVFTGSGNGPIDAFVQALRAGAGFDIHVLNYHEHAIAGGEDATAVAYVQLRIGAERTAYGVGMDSNIVTATLRAVLSAVNRALRQGTLEFPASHRIAYA